MPTNCHICDRTLQPQQLFKWRKGDEKVYKCNYCGKDVCDSCSKHKMHVDYIPDTSITAKNDTSHVRICKICADIASKVFIPLNRFMIEVFPHFDVFILGHEHIKYSHAATSFLVHLLTKFHDPIGPCGVFLESHFGDSYSGVKGALNYTDMDASRYHFAKALENCNGISCNEQPKEIMDVLDQYMSNQTSDLHVDYWQRLGHPEYSVLGDRCKDLNIPVYTFDDDLSMIHYKSTTDLVALEQKRHFYKKRDGVRNKLLMRDRANYMIGDRISRLIREYKVKKSFVVIGEFHLFDTKAGPYALQQFFAGHKCVAISVHEGKVCFKRFSQSDMIGHSKDGDVYYTNHPDYTIGWPNIYKKQFL
ncbi:MAG: hypothetical protein GY750_19835 [Lentisphaerae bacterium]|nr:hypothetical protein [Lentisphaerota bacterium]MCP4103646.1 hypothetical protein [Lentisphaerota bacterium]